MADGSIRRSADAGDLLESSCIGVLLAAGRGRRAGGSKQLLPWATEAGVQTLVAASFDAVAWACREMVVVLGHEPQRVRRALGTRACTLVEVDPDAPMSESVRAGLAAALSHSDERPGGGSAPAVPWILIHLGDHPSVASGTIRRLVAHARGAVSDAPRAIIPEFSGRGGHPALIPPGLARRIINAPLVGGLRRFWIENPGMCLRVPVADPGVVRDLDRLPGG